jgi:AhpD family alkylhydroperoxidase
MGAYASHGSVDKRRFEMYALAASIAGKCHFCVKSHFALLKNEQRMSAQGSQHSPPALGINNTKRTASSPSPDRACFVQLG